VKNLHSRLILSLVILFTLLFALHWLWANTALSRLGEEQALLNLERESDALSGAILVDDRYRASLQKREASRDLARADASHYYTIIIGQPQYGQQQFKSSSLGGSALPTPPLGKGQTAKQVLVGTHQQSILVFSKGYVLRGLPMTVSIGENTSHRQQLVKKLGEEGAIVSAAMLLVAMVLFWRVINRLLKPLVELQDDLEEAVLGTDRTKESYRIRTDPYEIQRLVHLASQRLERSRAAMSSLTHLLKTPLAAIIQIANNDRLNELPEVKQDLLDHAKSIQSELEYKLKHAQLAGVASAETSFNPSKELDSLILALNSIYRHKGIAYDIQVPDQGFLIDRQDSLELLGNLLDNASKWAKKNIRLTIRHEGDSLLVLVEDDGPGCTELELKLLSDSGLWLNERNSGHGLGLSLVRSITKLYSGSFTMGRSQALGGFSARVLIKCRLV